MRARESWDVANKQFCFRVSLDYCGKRSHATKLPVCINLVNGAGRHRHIAQSPDREIIFHFPQDIIELPLRHVARHLLVTILPPPALLPSFEHTLPSVDVTQALRDARDLLLVANRDNRKALGDFGYSVDDSPQARAKTKLTS